MNKRHTIECSRIIMGINNGGRQILSQEIPDGEIRFTRQFPHNGEMVAESETVISAGDMVLLLNHYTNCQEQGLPLVQWDYSINDKFIQALEAYIDELTHSLGAVMLDDEIASLNAKIADTNILVAQLLMQANGWFRALQSSR